jgi:hypothetical protein
MWQITTLGVKRWKRNARAFVNPPNPKLSLHYRQFMRKNKPRGRRPWFQMIDIGTKKFKRMNRDYPLPFRQPFVPYVALPGPQKWRNANPQLDSSARASNPLLDSSARASNPLLNGSARNANPQLDSSVRANDPGLTHIRTNNPSLED